MARWLPNPRPSRAAVALIALAATLAAVPAHAQSQSPSPTAAPRNPCAPQPVTATVIANSNLVGFVSLHFQFAGGAPVTYYECVGTRARQLQTVTAAPDAVDTPAFHATTWRCGRLTRTFAGTATVPGRGDVLGITDVHTPPCNHRFDIRLPTRVRTGARVRLRIADRWKIGGVRTRLCLTPPGRRTTCRRVTFRANLDATRLLRADRRGIWRVELVAGSSRLRRTLAVGTPPAAPAAPRPVVLATGDSTMQGIDAFLDEQLGDDVGVRADVRPGFAISHDDGWLPVARVQARRWRPSIAVVSIGGNEGFPLRGIDGASHACCDAGWVDAYARRARASMLAYLDGSPGSRVYWLTIVAPREERRVAVVTAVNSAIEAAAQGLSGVTVLHMDRFFTPSGYRETVRYGGRDVPVRLADGVHLNVNGTRIAAQLVVRAIRGRTLPASLR